MMRTLSIALIGTAVGGALTAADVVRRHAGRWGATETELTMALPGDELLTNADLSATRAITIDAAPQDVWPWIAQIGQGRGGFYSYDSLENLVGCDIHSADRIHPEWQHPQVGSTVNLAPALSLDVAIVEPGRAMVLRGGVPMGSTAPPYDFTWSFVVRADVEGGARLIARERYRYTRRWAALIVQPAGLVSSLMSPRMLRGIKGRVEQSGRTRPSALPSQKVAR